MLNNFGILAPVSYASCTVLELGASKTALNRKTSVINALHTCKPTYAIHIQPFAWLPYMRPGSKDRSTQCCRMAGNSGMLPDSYACYESRSPPFTKMHTTCRLPWLTVYIHAGGNFARLAELPCVRLIASGALDEQAGNGSVPRLAALYNQEILVNIPGQRHKLNIALCHGKTSKYCHK